ncbi:MAG TPA: class I SAM-dependent RNA methyltransferase, partial [Candidatus Jeotgalibaca merdavium]|nr:class I SAM-dependent RNA methyltransferase [Candidatus Jeotgalibaca merdavium]
AEKAGVEDFVSFKQMQLKDFTTEKEYGVIVSNPPYGERMDDQESVERLYKEMGDVFRPLETWSKYIITSDLLFEEFYGQRATKKRKLYNGRLRTDYFQYWGKRAPRKPRTEETN